jgi:branched-chain amino acid transport system substrate-binding protein
MVRYRSIVRLGVALAATSLVLAACGGGGQEEQGGTAGGGASEAATTVKIGLMGDLTGENSGIVIPLRNAAKLAIEDYNATNPATKIELVEYDSQGVPEQATALAQQAIKTDKIVGLIGPAAGWTHSRRGHDPQRYGVSDQPRTRSERVEVLAPHCRKR